ncbi:hypothetical protein NG895_21625 [Aeoliella sp. ICT_H6.2]|uniref:Uncharacterized protein n=1 Tax=Aeoliella straminimaris TaxID=2954799 RepID=A0A9X2FE48_9BACT|nr:hypothetical protein [Aeoliella straminimaris]MCO6046508.1 hypothetical protein [Aeoliella straminimaris]
MKSILALSLFAMAVCLGLVGCNGNANSPGDSPAAANVDGSRYMLSEEPDGAVGVIAARESAEDGKPIVLVGRIGGASNPWIDGRAAFMLIDPSVTVVADGTKMEDGEVCMDDCCAGERAGCTTLVKFVDDQGQVVPVDSRKLLGVNEADMVVVEGTAKKDAQGNFSMLATGLFVRM